jgi:hypothetical protein
MKFVAIFYEKSFMYDGESKEEYGDIILLTNTKHAELWIRGMVRERAETIVLALNSYFGYES